MAISQERKCKLADDLVKATAPSEHPDDNFRPTHWSDRMYYMLRCVIKSDRFDRCAATLCWDKAASFVATDIVFKSDLRHDDNAFESLERLVAEELQKRGLTTNP